MTPPNSKLGSNSNGQYRRVLRDFGGSDTIQGTEDWPIDPDVEDAKLIGLAVLFGAAVLAIVPQETVILGWAAVGLFVALAGVVIYICPSERAPLEWITAMARFWRKPKRLTNHAEDHDERTQTLTHIDRMLHTQGAVRRRDGALVGLVEVEGTDMALAEEDAWASAAEGFEKMARAVDSTVEIYSPARTVHPNRLTKGYMGREREEDVKRNETLQHLVSVYRNELPQEFAERGTAVRRFYVVLSVTPREVRRDDQGALAKLADLPGIGEPIRRFGLARRGPSEAEIEERQKSILSARKRAVQQSISSTAGCVADDVDGEHLAALLEEFWTGTSTQYEGKPAYHQQTPVVIYNQTDDETDPAKTGGQ